MTYLVVPASTVVLVIRVVPPAAVRDQRGRDGNTPTSHVPREMNSSPALNVQGTSVHILRR